MPGLRAVVATLDVVFGIVRIYGDWKTWQISNQEKGDPLGESWERGQRQITMRLNEA